MTPEQIDLLIQEQGPLVFDRMFETMEKVRERLNRVCAALGSSGVPYAIVGGHAVAAWVSTRDEGVIRGTQDVDVLLRKEDFGTATDALNSVGFVSEHVMDVTMFIDGPEGKPSQGVHVLWAGQKVDPRYVALAPLPDQSRDIGGKRIIDLVELVRMKLNSYRRKDQVHLLDLIGVDLIDSSWPARFEPELAERLQILLDDPDG